MAIVVKWAADGQYMRSGTVDTALGPWIDWTAKRRKAKRFEDQSDFRKWTRSLGILPADVRPGWWSNLRFIRLIPRKRHVPPQP